MDQTSHKAASKLTFLKDVGSYSPQVQYLIASLGSDKMGDIVKADFIILEVADWLLDKQTQKKESTPAMRQRVRGLARILIEMR